MRCVLKDLFDSVYVFFMMVWAFTGALFTMRNTKEMKFESKLDKLLYYIYGIGSSMLIGWVACEVGLYFNLPIKLSGAIGGLAGFIGANTIVRLFLIVVDKKIKGDD